MRRHRKQDVEGIDHHISRSTLEAIGALGGIAIAIGAMVDAAIIMVENAHKSLEHFREEKGRDPDGRERAEVIMRAAQSVGRRCSSLC